MPSIPRLPASIPQSRVKQTQYGAPILLSAGTVIQASEFATLTSDALRNNTASPIEIHELRFAGHVVGAVQQDVIFLGADFIDVELRVGGVKLTNNPVSVALLARAEHGPIYVAETIDMRSKLARPIVLMPQQAIEVTIYHRSVNAYPIAVQFSAAGRAVSKLPAGQRWLPYFASYQATVTMDRTNPTTVLSSESDLINSTGKNLRVERIAGRFLTFGTRVFSALTVAVNDEPNLHQLDPVASALYSSTTVRITDSRGFDLALNTPMPAVFDPARRTWETPFNMPAGGYLITETTLPTSAADIPYARIGYGLIGYREV